MHNRGKLGEERDNFSEIFILFSFWLSKWNDFFFTWVKREFSSPSHFSLFRSGWILSLSLSHRSSADAVSRVRAEKQKFHLEISQQQRRKEKKNFFHSSIVSWVILYFFFVRSSVRSLLQLQSIVESRRNIKCDQEKKYRRAKKIRGKIREVRENKRNFKLKEKRVFFCVKDFF